MIAGFVRGLSVRDVENTLADALGAEAALSKSTVSRVCQAIGDEFDAWSDPAPGRPGAGLPVPGRLDVQDAPRRPRRAGAGRVGHHHRRQAGVRRAGRRRQSSPPTPGASFLDELRGRGLRPPLLVISDGAAGLISAIESSLPRSLRQKCLIHRCRNVLAKVPATAQDEIRGRLLGDLRHRRTHRRRHRARAASSSPPCRRASTPSPRQYASSIPAAVKCLLTDREQLTSYLRFPVEHHKRIRHSNFIERTFGETRRRVKVIGRLPGETSCLNLVWAVLDRASRGWRGLTTTTDRHPPARTTYAASSSTRPPRSARTSHRSREHRKLSEPSPNIPTKEPSRRHLHRLWDATEPRLPMSSSAQPGDRHGASRDSEKAIIR